MRLCTLPLAVALALLCAFTFAIPMTESAMSRRSDRGLDTPALSIAETSSATRRSAAVSLPHRLVPRVVLPGPAGTHTQLILAVGAATTASVGTLLSDAYEMVVTTITSFGDGLIPHGIFRYLGPSALQVQVWNADNHQTTYGVLATTLKMLGDYVAEHGQVVGTFIIREGGREVGQGKIFQGTK